MVIRQAISVPSKINCQRGRHGGVPNGIHHFMTQSSKLICTTISFSEDMRTNYRHTVLQTVMPVIPQTDRNESNIFKCMHNTRRVAFQPQTVPMITDNKFHSYNQTHQLRFKNRPTTNITSKASQKGSSKITKSSTTRSIKISNRAICISLHPSNGGRLPNHGNNFFDTPESRGIKKLFKTTTSKGRQLPFEFIPDIATKDVILAIVS